MVVLSLTTQYASAAVAPPRIELSCPDGSTQSLQAREWICAPNLACQASVDCGEAQVCEPASLCIETWTVKRRSGIKPDGSPNTWSRAITQAHDRCDAGGGCEAGECSGESRCVDAPPEPAQHAEEVVSPVSTQEAPGASAPTGSCSSLPAAAVVGPLMVTMLGLQRRRRTPLG